MLVRIGTRNSPMALVQAEHVRDLLLSVSSDVTVEIVGMQTSADKWQGDLSLLGGKANFTKEIDHALVAGEVDLAVHCMKDVAGDVPLPEGTIFGAYLPRDDVRDVVVSANGLPLAKLAAGSRVGTSSVRRTAQLLSARPDLVQLPIRGNVNSRLAKLDRGEFDALILARAGLVRLGMAERITEILPIEPDKPLTMVPAVGAGVLGLQVRENDVELRSLVSTLNHAPTTACVTAERAMLHALGGHCNSPIAGHAHIDEAGQLSLLGFVYDAIGKRQVQAQSHDTGAGPQDLGARVAHNLLAQGAADLIAETRH